MHRIPYVNAVLTLNQLLISCSTAPLNNDRPSLLSTVRNTDCKLIENTDSFLTQTLLYENSEYEYQCSHPKCYYCY